jgi:outer membrane protein insertion porin family
MKRDAQPLMSKFIKDFRPQKKYPRMTASLIGFLLVFSLQFRLYPQVPESLQTVDQIYLTIDGEPGDAEMKNLIPMEEGEPFSLKRISEIIKQLYQTGLFSDIEVLRESDQGVDLTFRLTRKLFIRRIDFVGSSEIPQKKLKENLYSLREDGAYSEENLDKAIEEIKGILDEDGFFQPEIEPIIEKDPVSPHVDVSFMIHTSKRYTIGSIDFTGSLILSEQELRKRMHTREGQEFIPSQLQTDLDRLRELYNSMDYRRAEVLVKEQSFDESRELVFLHIQVLPQQKIEFRVIGADVPLDLIKPIWEAQIFEEWGLSEGEAKITNYLRKKGYLFPTVDSSVQHGDNLMRIIHKVTPGKHYKIQGVNFEGLEYFTPEKIKDELLMKQRFSLFQRIDGARLFELPREIELLYQSHGFPEAKVELYLQKEDKKIRPILSIQEGKQEKIDRISITGTSFFREDVLLEQISSVKGGPFFQPEIQKDIEELKRFYMNQGFRGTEIEGVVQPMDDSLYSVRFEVDEGHRIQVENVIITGNEATKKNTISRELLLKEGDYARYDAILGTKRNLERLGIFTEVRIDEIPTTSHRANLLVNVREGERNYAGLGLGLESKDQLRTFAVWDNAYRLRGIAEYIRYNVFGSAAQASLVGQISLKETRGVFSWRQPYFFGLPLETYLNIWVEREERKTFTYEGSGISLTTVKSISKKENMDFLTTLKYAERTITKLEYPDPSEIDRRFYPFSTTSISGSYIWEKRDDPFNPTKGFFFSTALEWAFPYFKAESDFLKMFNKFQYHVSIIPGLTLASTTRLGLAKGRVPIYERFFAGGSSSFRGAEFDELGPKDPDSGKPVGGKALLLFNFELTFPVISTLKDLYGSVFYDKGNVFSTRKRLSLAGLQDALGLGLRYRTPLGPVRLEIAWNLDAPTGEKNILGFITIGNVF